LAITFLLSAVISLLAACDLKKEHKYPEPRIPYPSNERAIFLQGKVDSSQFEWFKDAKATASAFCNEELRHEGPVSTSDVIIIGQGPYQARVEVQLPSRMIILTMERPFKHKGNNSIWQVVKLEEKGDG
jgi:hypothetical protein